MKNVIIPAAGKATRFGGTLKELLPINETDTPMLRAIQNAVLGMNADTITITTNIEKIGEHARYIDRNVPYGVPINFRLLKYSNDMWGSILSSIDWNSSGGLVMPDTVTFINPEESTAPFALGTFWTRQPERFSVLWNNSIATKQQFYDDNVDRNTLSEYKAWGTVEWGTEVAEFWQEHEYTHYDDAFRAAMDMFGYATYDLPYYYDLGTFKAYTDYIKENK